MYRDLYLKFSSDAEARSVIFKIVGAVLADPGRGIEAVPGAQVLAYRNIDILGTICEPTGETQLVNGMQVPVTAPIDGFHVNVRLGEDEDETPLIPYKVYPKTPSRVWA